MSGMLGPVVGHIGSTNTGLVPSLPGPGTLLAGDVTRGTREPDVMKEYGWYRDNYEDVASYRQDTVSDINWGMTVVANAIKFVSLLMTVAGGASGGTDR